MAGSKGKAKGGGSPGAVTLDDLLFKTPGRAIGRAAQWGAEVPRVLVLGFAVVWVLAHLGALPGGLLLAVVAALAGWVGPLRRMIQRRLWCVVTRHRLYMVFVECRLYSRAGHMPVVLRVKPTKVGESCLVWCRAGFSGEAFEARVSEFASGCWARDARVTAGKRFSHLITVEVIRRDTLSASARVVPTLLERVKAARKPDPAPSAPDPESAPVYEGLIVPASGSASQVTPAVSGGEAS